MIRPVGEVGDKRHILERRQALERDLGDDDDAVRLVERLIGADDAIRVNADPADSFFVAAQIAEQAKGYDLILMGRESIDYNSGVVHSIVGEMLGIPSVSPVMKLEIDGNKDTAGTHVQAGTNRDGACVSVVEAKAGNRSTAGEGGSGCAAHVGVARKSAGGVGGI